MSRRILYLAVLAIVLIPAVAVNAKDNEGKISEKIDKLIEERFKKFKANIVKDIDINDITEERLKKLKANVIKDIDDIAKDVDDIVADELWDVNKVDKKDISKNISSALDLITPELLKRHEYYLASDELEGRGTGYPGNDKATEYIAKQFKAAGLKPIGDKDDNGNPTYFQNFTVGKLKLKTRNCVGLLEGSDDKLKDEVIIIGGHHDHLGKGEQKSEGRMGGVVDGDDIWNGADDNASGTSTVLSLAKAFGEGAIHPKRSILFMTFSGEELGLLGSQYYVKHPILPLEKTAEMVNLDMVGRNPRAAVDISGISSFKDPDVIRDMLEKNSSRTDLKIKVEKKIGIFWLASDQASFGPKNVPALFFFTGQHKDYHRVTDHPEKIAYNHMTLVAKTIFLFLNDAANKDNIPSIAADFKEKLQGIMPKGGNQEGPRLGIQPSYEGLTDEERKSFGLKEKEGGLKIEMVMDNGVARKVGLKDGDVIVLLDGKPLNEESPMETLQGFLSSVRRGKDYEIMVLRKGERKAFTVRWEEAKGGDHEGTPRLGVQSSVEFTDEERKSFGLKEKEGGLKIDAVMEGSVAHKVGLKDGDIIVLLDGKPLDEESPRETLQGFLSSVKKGKDYEIVVLRNGKRKTFTIRWE